MNRLMSKGLLIYTAALFFTAITLFVITVPQYSIFAGVATLAAITIVLITGVGRDLQSAVTSEPRD